MECVDCRHFGHFGLRHGGLRGRGRCRDSGDGRREDLSGCRGCRENGWKTGEMDGKMVGKWMKNLKHSGKCDEVLENLAEKREKH